VRLSVGGGKDLSLLNLYNISYSITIIHQLLNPSICLALHQHLLVKQPNELKMTNNCYLYYLFYLFIHLFICSFTLFYPFYFIYKLIS